MRHFIFTEKYGKPNRYGHRVVTVEVYSVKKNVPSYIGCKKADTGGWVGGYGTACQVISRETGMKLKDSYGLVSQNVKITEV